MAQTVLTTINKGHFRRRFRNKAGVQINPRGEALLFDLEVGRRFNT